MEEHHLCAAVIRAFPEVELRGGLIYFLKSDFMRGQQEVFSV